MTTSLFSRSGQNQTDARISFQNLPPPSHHVFNNDEAGRTLEVLHLLRMQKRTDNPLSNPWRVKGNRCTEHFTISPSFTCALFSSSKRGAIPLVSSRYAFIEYAFINQMGLLGNTPVILLAHVGLALWRQIEGRKGNTISVALLPPILHPSLPQCTTSLTRSLPHSSSSPLCSAYPCLLSTPLLTCGCSETASVWLLASCSNSLAIANKITCCCLQQK